MNTLKFLLSIIFIIGISANSEAQFLKKLAKKAEEKIEREAEKRTEKRVDKKIDEGYDEIEDEIDGKNKKDKTAKENENEEGTNKTAEEETNASSNDANANTESTETNTDKPKPPTVVWSRYDFVPGDTVIYEDGPGADEENGEFPSRWDLYKGNAEIITVDGTNVISFPQGGAIVPYLTNAKEDYLPEIFTIEFDAYFKPENSRRIFFELYDRKNQRNDDTNRIYFYKNSVSYGESDGSFPSESANFSDKGTGTWRHISIAYTKGKFKVYMDDTRLLNIPHLEGNPKGITFEMDGYAADKPEDIQYMKNFRIAKGGVKYYDRILSEGKIIVNGIKFDINKATLKPESMGPINNIFEMMQKNPDLNFSVEGHTDSDGSDESNMTLSEARAKTVMNQLISMGIAADRLKSAGWGESKPIAGNDTPEGKANNRRVEFVKF